MIPEELREYPLIRVEKRGKGPVVSPEAVEPASDIIDWIKDGGNYGVKATADNDLVICDIDSVAFREAADDLLPSTFADRTGGGGEHRFYSCPEWTENTQISRDGDDLGSVRSSNWYVVGPGSVHPSGDRYERIGDAPIRSVDPADLEALIDRLTEAGDDRAANTGGGRRRAARVGGSQSVPSIPDEYPSREAGWPTLKSWLDASDFLGDLRRRGAGDRSGHEFKLAKCLAEGGFSESAISGALDRLPYDSKWHSRGEDYRRRTVRKAIRAAVEDPYVSFDRPADMDAEASERRKTEESGPNRTLRGGDTDMADFTDHEEVTILEGEDDGDSFKKVVRSTRTENGDTIEYVAIKRGRVEEVELRSGEVGLTERVTDSTSIGSPEYIEELAEALFELSEKIEE